MWVVRWGWYHFKLHIYTHPNMAQAVSMSQNDENTRICSIWYIITFVKCKKTYIVTLTVRPLRPGPLCEWSDDVVNIPSYIFIPIYTGHLYWYITFQYIVSLDFLTYAFLKLLKFLSFFSTSELRHYKKWQSCFFWTK